MLRSPSFPAMFALGVMLLALFVAWIMTAQAIYETTLRLCAGCGSDAPIFVQRVLTTPDGWALIVVGCGVGFLFALARCA